MEEKPKRPARKGGKRRPRRPTTGHRVHIPISNMAELKRAAEIEAAAAAAAAELGNRRRNKTTANRHGQAVKALANEMKQFYVQPPIDMIPYNKNMVRTYANTENLTEEQLAKRHKQAISSRISRDRLRFVDDCIRVERDRCEKELYELMEKLLIKQDAIDALLVDKKMPWGDVWAERENEIKTAGGDDEMAQSVAEALARA